MKTCEGCQCLGCIKKCEDACEICKKEQRANCPVTYCRDRIADGKQMTIFDFIGEKKWEIN